MKEVIAVNRLAKLLVFLPLIFCVSLQSCSTSETGDPSSATIGTESEDITETDHPAAVYKPLIGEAEAEARRDAVMGEGTGIYPGRVVWAYNPEATDWNGTGLWHNSTNFDEAVIYDMINESLCALTGEETASDAWNALFAYQNNRAGEGTDGYKKGEKIAIKLNMNGSADSKGQTKQSFASPVMVRAFLRSMVNEGGVPPEDITLTDPSRVIPDFMINMCSANELAGVKFAFKTTGKYEAVADKTCKVVWSEEFEGEDCYLPTCMTEARYLINFANLKGHNLAGVTLGAKNHFGTIMNSDRNNPPQAANIHPFVCADDFTYKEGWNWKQRPMGTYTVLADFFANKYIGGKTMLTVFDALFVAQHQGANVTADSKWKSAPFNGDYTSSILMSQDPVAIDSVGVDFLLNEPTVNSNKDVIADNTTLENYLHEAALAGNPPSGTIYKDGAGEAVGSLGVHEHWNNSDEKLYSRNLGLDFGIELVKIGVATSD